MNDSKFSHFKIKPNNLPFFNGPFDKITLKKLIVCFLDEYGEKNTLDFLEKLKQLGFAQATQAGISLGLDDLKIPETKRKFLLQTNIALQTTEYNNLSGNITSIEKSQGIIDLWNNTSELLRENVVESFKYQNPLNPLSMMAFSGARGNVSQVRQLVGMRGLMADPQGTIVEFPIQSNFREGITFTEYLISCYGARKGLVDTALRTATSGYLTRRLVDAVQHLVISSIDCGTTAGLYIKKPQSETSIIGRVLLKKINKKLLNIKKINNFFPFFMANNKFDLVQKKTTFIEKNQIISLTLAKQIYTNQDEIYVRSPLTCQSYKSICQLCYGWDLAKGDLVNIGEAVGVIAAQSIGEPGTQLTMRTFHTGGVGIFSDESLKTFKAPSEGIINFPEDLAGGFIRTPHGKIVYMLKYNHIEPTRILLELKVDQHSKSFFNLQESQLPPGSILLVRQGQHVIKNTIIAQTSQIKTSTQNMPESLHPIQSKMGGEIRFEYMIISALQPNSQFNLSLGGHRKDESFLSQIQYKSKQLASEYLKNSNKKLFPVKGIVPMTHSLLKVGSFWVLSAHNQREPYPINSFFQIGDLISNKSPIFQLNFKALYQARLKRISSKIIFEKPILNIPINIIRFHKTTYSSLCRESKKKSIIYWSHNIYYKTQIFQFFWRFDNWSIKNSGFNVFSKKYIKVNLIKNSVKFKRKSNINLIRSKILQKRIICTKSYHLAATKFLLDKYMLYYGNNLFIPYFFLLLDKNLALNVAFLTSTNFKVLQNSKRVKTPTIFIVNNILNFSIEVGFYKIMSKYINLSRDSSTKLLKSKSIYIQNKKLREKKINQKKFLYSLTNHTMRIGQFAFYHLKEINTIFVKKNRTNKTIIHYKKNWIFVSFTQKFNIPISNFNLPTKKFFLTKNNTLDNLSFENTAISLEYLPLSQIHILQQKKLNKCAGQQPLNLLWYNKEYILYHNSCWYSIFSFKKQTVLNTQVLRQMDVSLFFYKLTALSKFELKTQFNSIQKKELIPNKNKIHMSGLCIQKMDSKNLPCNLNLPKHWASLILKREKAQLFVKNTSPIFSKQSISQALQKLVPNKVFKIQSNYRVGWQLPKTLLKINLALKPQNDFKNLYSGFVPNTSNSYPNLNLDNSIIAQKKRSFKRENFQLISYTLLPSDNFVFNYKNLNFETFNNGCILPATKLAVGFKMSKASGEFLRLKKTLNQTYWSSLEKTDIITLNLPIESKELTIRIGQFFRWGQSVYAQFISPFNGQIIKIDKFKLHLRRGLPILASKRGIIHVSDNDLILKNKLLITLKSRQLQTQDIVQGIPKIEQLFEARETQTGEKLPSIHKRLQGYFLNALDIFYDNNNYKLAELTLQNLRIDHFEFANKAAILNIQNFIVDNIIKAYLNQGVSISEKHVEIIVREMTTRVRILASGSTGFLPGEFIQFKMIQQINKKLCQNNGNPAFYDPIILGITKSVLHSESFLLAASFQEVSRILVSSACNKKTDFLSGLHENVIVGQLIPAGAVIFSKLNKK
uniref:DNA-directed RNA polymerase n=1 Tax=Prototheca wickerhamii TaxID=3111 RepID=A0A067Z0A8_PROWI|nr:beta subunit of RNA polymerase [Prototheca wickerhamii]